MSAPSISIRLICQVVGEVYGVDPGEIVGPRRDTDTYRARQAACLLARELTALSQVVIGRCLGGRDQTTVAHAIAGAEQLAASDETFAARLEAARRAVLDLAAATPASPLAAIDAIAAAERIFDWSPRRQAVRTSVDEVVSMAHRLLLAEEVLAGTAQLFASLAELETCTDAVRHGELVHSANALRATLASELIALGYEGADIDNHHEDQHDGEAHQDRGPAAPRAAE